MVRQFNCRTGICRAPAATQLYRADVRRPRGSLGSFVRPRCCVLSWDEHVVFGVGGAGAASAGVAAGWEYGFVPDHLGAAWICLRRGVVGVVQSGGPGFSAAFDA